MVFLLSWFVVWFALEVLPRFQLLGMSLQVEKYRVVCLG